MALHGKDSFELTLIKVSFTNWLCCWQHSLTVDLDWLKLACDSQIVRPITNSQVLCLPFSKHFLVATCSNSTELSIFCLCNEECHHMSDCLASCVLSLF